MIRAAGQLESRTKTPREKLPADFYDKLEKNKQAFTFATTEEDVELKAQRGGSDSTLQVLKILKAVRDFRQYTEAQEAYLKRVMNRLEEARITKADGQDRAQGAGKRTQKQVSRTRSRCSQFCKATSPMNFWKATSRKAPHTPPVRGKSSYPNI